MKHRPRQHLISGWTVIELLIALVVAAVLVAIAVPSYQSHIKRSQRADGVAALLNVQTAQEKFFLQTGVYSASLTEGPPAGLGLAKLSPQGHYAVEISVSAPSAYTAKAVRVSTDTRCVELTLNQNGLRQARDAQGKDTTEDCWR